jgi:glucan phosphoethanolaminetransferase (alkaline phosphatase superfamily)
MSATTANRFGENRIYLHGLPYFMAPDEQKHVAASCSRRLLRNRQRALRAMAAMPFSHDNLFHPFGDDGDPDLRVQEGAGYP